MGFIRFVLAQTHPASGLHEGLFRLAYRLRDEPEVAAHDRTELGVLMAWFDEHLPVPDRFNRTSSKGHYRRATQGISWLRDSAVDCISRMYRVRDILEEYGHPVNVICEGRVGYIVYEDRLQVVAEPFADTETRSHG